MKDSENDYVALEVDWALAFLHGMKRLHLDMKSDRALVVRDGNSKLTSIGFCAELTKTRAKRKKGCRNVKATKASNSHDVHRGCPA